MRRPYRLSTGRDSGMEAPTEAIVSRQVPKHDLVVVRAECERCC
jgi:hypothetical protein